MENSKNRPDPYRYCFVTGLPVTRKPEWTDVHFNKGYRSTISLLGDNILISRPHGHISLSGVKRTLAMIGSILDQSVPNERPYVIIEDFSKLRGATIRARKYFIDYMNSRRRLQGLIFISNSELFKVSIKLGKRLYAGKNEILIADNYLEAVRLALNILSNEKTKAIDPKADRAHQIYPPKGLTSYLEVFSRPEWSIQDEAFSINMHILGERILYAISTGFFQEKHIKPMSELREKIRKAVNLNNAFDYIIADVTNVSRITVRSRQLYMDSLKKWHQRYPFRSYIFCGANRFVRAAIYLAGPFIPFKLQVTNDIGQALQLVLNEEPKQLKARPKKIAASPASLPRTPDQIQAYVDELLHHLGGIDWDSDGLGDDNQVDLSHPFYTVFEAVNLIKGEFDDLFKERKRTEDALQRAKEDLETKVKERTADIEKTNRELQKKTMAAEAASRAKSNFLANMSHELRTPLNHILGFTELVADKKIGDLNETQEEYLKDAIGSSKHLLSLINDILDLSKVEAGKLDLELSDIYLKSLFEDSLMVFEQAALKHGIKMSLEIDKIPSTIKADGRKLKQILYNLLSNAVKFTPDGGQVCLHARPNIIGRNGKAANVKISVSDTGIGLYRKDLERIFRSFEQVEDSQSRRFPGTGLGLSLTKKLVELHHGRIWAESEGENKGSTFTFIIPA